MYIPVVTIPTIKRLIIADDDQEDQMLIRETIDEHDFAPLVTIASDGSELMRYIRLNPLPDLILLDLNMPNKNGFECLAEIRSNERFQDLPVVILSTSKNIKDIELCYKNGASLFFSKPYTFGSLRVLIHSLINIDWAHFPKVDRSSFIKISKLGLVPEVIS